MSSLPQGWHGIPGPSKNSLSGTGKTSSPSVPTTIRKKWNSPLSTEMPKSKLPSYKNSNLRLQNSCKVNGVSTSSKLSPTSKLPPCPEKTSVNKEYQNEISKLKKELSTIKAENSILKAKVRRVDDENAFKSRQIEKLRAELKAMQKNEATSSKKNKDSELLALRQKCLRLEGVVKEKDLALKKLAYEVSMKTENSKDVNKDVPSGNSSKKIGEVASKIQKTTTKESSLSASVTLSRVSQSLKLEVMKLRDMIHKLEKENQELQQQVKENGQENRRLKMQLRNKSNIPTQGLGVKANPIALQKVAKSDAENTVPNTSTKGKVTKSVAPNHIPVINTKAQVNVLPSKAVQSKKNVPLKKTEPKQGSNVDKSKKSTSLSQVKKQALMNQNSVMLSSSQSTSTFVVSKPVRVCKLPVRQKLDISLEAGLETKIQEMRENIAAKKIQKGWHEYQKRCVKGLRNQSEERALTFIISSLKHHTFRKDKLNCFAKKRSFKPSTENERDFDLAIEVAKRNIWNS